MMYARLLADLSEITPTVARHVLAHFGDSHGYRAGSFTTSLIETIARADVINMALLATGYPGYVKAVCLLAQNADDGIFRLRGIAQRDLVQGGGDAP